MDLRPAARLVSSLRSRIEGNTYESFVAKQAAIEQALQQLAADREQIKRLTDWTLIREVFARLHETRSLNE